MTVVATYIYKDIETGDEIAKKVRLEPKSFEWHSDKGKVDERTLPLYNAYKLTDFPPEKVVVFVEGEKAADALQAMGILAVCLPGGAASKPSAEQLKVLSGRRVALWPDKDQPGRMLMRRIYEKLRPVALELRAIYPSSLPPKGDAFDFVQAGGTKEELAKELQLNPRHILVDKSLSIVNLEDVEQKELEWIWPGYLPQGMLVMLEGAKGVGKSWLTLQLAAMISCGKVSVPGTPEGTKGVGKVMLLCHEDPIDEIIVPRLKAMGADLQNIRILQSTVDLESGEEQWFDLKEDVQALEDELNSDDYQLLIIDPINNYINTSIDSYRDSHMRAVLSPLAAMAQRTDVCSMGIRHFKKSKEGGMLDWGVGSIAYGAVARTVHAVIRDPVSQYKERLLFPVETNIGVKPAPIAFQIVDDGLGATFEWRGTRDYTEEFLIASMKETSATKTQDYHDAKVEQLQVILSDGKAHLFKQVQEKLGVSAITLLDYLYRSSYTPEEIDINGEIPAINWDKANKLWDKKGI